VTPEPKVVKPSTRAKANKAVTQRKSAGTEKTVMKTTPMIQKQRNGTTTGEKTKSPNSAIKTVERGKKKTGVV